MINVAIIGLGNISPAHIHSYTKFPERCKITAFVDIYPEKAEASAKTHNIDAKIYASHEDILDDPTIDLVSICTPPYCHAEIAIDFLKAGKHVIVEKPMAPSLKECDEMIAAAKESGKVFSVIAQNRFRDPISNLKAVLDSGKIGRILHAQIDSFWWRGHCYYDLWWRGNWEKEGGGCTLNHAVHHIDMLGWIMGLPMQVTSVITNTNHDNAEVEDLSVAIMQYDKGALAQVTSSVVHHGEEQQLIFQGEYARVSAPWRVCAAASTGNGFPKAHEALEKEIQAYYETLPSLEHIAHAGQIDNVLTAIEESIEPLIDGESGRMTVELITAIYKAGILKQTVSLPIAKDDAYYTAEGIQANAPHFFEKSASVEQFSASTITVGSDYGNYGKKLEEKEGDL